ncbi:EscU/YscU/HrcU family type III secretion system export apparatus switch protein [Glacieibacterium sp.]|uniref:EscU/YscU/HrcU family type III secretion system export apparatus switch protein n=1 Tax=Glacieibacterium sp. TaxID=2860237 RepID=UPI003AFFD715
MAEKNDGGDKTEAPTQKRISDARKKGDVVKSKDLTSVAGLFAWLLLTTFGAGFAGDRLAALFNTSFDAVARGLPFAQAWSDIGFAAFWLFVLLTAVTMIPAALVGLFAEFMQTGAIFTFEKMTPSLDKLNPIEGLKKMFSMDNVVELAKTVAKALLMLLITFLVLRASLPEIVAGLPTGAMPTMQGVGRAAASEALRETGTLTARMLMWTLAAFVGVAIVDISWQKHSYTKKLRMSLRDIRDEVKENEGDPYIRQQRKAMHQEYANQNAVGAARTANVLVVNPTHLAIALDYDPETCPVPIVAAKGEGPLAQAMREAAESAGVPIIRNIDVARALFERGVINDLVPRDMFEAIAEIILWARKERDAMIERRK